jgi:Fe-S cluster biogenesis protein NfuA
VADPGGFQEQIKHLGELVTRFEQMPDSPQKAAGKELVQLLMEVHARGLERIMDIAFEGNETGSALLDQFGKDDVAGELLLLYSLHPDAFETRVQTAVERLCAKLRKLSCAIELLSIDEGAVRVQVIKSGHSCGSSAGELRTVIENGLYELAPDVTTLEILGLEEKSATGFVAIESLVGAATAVSPLHGSGMHNGDASQVAGSHAKGDFHVAGNRAGH